MAQVAAFDKYAQLGAYHWAEYARGTTYGRHAERMAALISERPVLDVGCGDGLITHLLDGFGIDPEPVGVDLAIARGVRARVGRVEDLPGCLPRDWPQRYGAVYLGDVLEHLTHPRRALRAIGRVDLLRNQGAP